MTKDSVLSFLYGTLAFALCFIFVWMLQIIKKKLKKFNKKTNCD